MDNDNKICNKNTGSAVCPVLYPSIIAETENYAVVYKPPRMHCAPLHGNGTLFDWYAELFPPVKELAGRKEGEGGLLHRLDYETQGLVLVAKNQQSLDNLLVQQNENAFIKEYSAVCAFGSSLSPGHIIESYFRPFGPGRKMVRPLTDEDAIPKKKAADAAKDQGGFYRTEIIGIEKCNENYICTVRLRRGFRHQIRCHLAWKGCPILNDPLYGSGGGGFLALRAHGLLFNDPETGKPAEYGIKPLP